MFKQVQNAITSVNTSKLFMGIAMILLNVGSKYIDLEFSKTQENTLKKVLTREILIFSILFTATHDLVISILMTAAFTVLASYLLNNESDYCIIPKHLWKIEQVIDTNNDGVVSPEEEEWALHILEKVGKKRNQQQQIMFNAHLDAYKY